MKKEKIPVTDSISELAKFWDTHDVADFEDQLEIVDEPVFVQRDSVSICLRPKEAKIVKGIAKAKGVKEADIIREWIREKIRAS